MSLNIEVIFAPAHLRAEHLRDRAVVVFDVLRATTSMVAALANGAKEVRVFDSLDEARAARRAARIDGVILAGEQRCLRPDDFDCGNSPSDFSSERVRGKTVLLSTTNGTRALIAASEAHELYAAALVNADATAKHLIERGRDVTLLCSGTGSEIAPEDVIGAGAVIDRMRIIDEIKLPTETALGAWQFYLQNRDDLGEALRETEGGRNVIAAGLEADIDFASQLDRFDLIARVIHDPLRVVSA